ncbi:hypothetical protein PM082_010066 [Marasmius tenuissimus]|nr:hypothetical protein PM082_010066 [Marasmius tenuissimus]
MSSPHPISYNAAMANSPAHSDPPLYGQSFENAGVFVTQELDRATEECRRKVSRIARECKEQNRRFRDHDFDLETDRKRCLSGLSTTTNYAPSDVQRVTQIFENPQFFIPNASYNDIVQGALGDCYFIAALALIRTAGGLAYRFCVARDEEIGVYGFIFFRDTSWVTVIIDDLLYTHIPKYEELTSAEKQIYHLDKERYNESARKSGKGLYFAGSGTHGETWVPLIEKAYAKLHGSYAALYGGAVGEAVEDMTGGVSAFVPTKDILDPEAFWNNELLKANIDRMFGCVFRSLDRTRRGEDSSPNLQGLFGDHCYSVLRAVEHRGKRFVIIRNPWGMSLWNGPWSDGSKEWTPEWLEALPKFNYSFGDNGEFIMEYKDFLECWDVVEKTRLFDSSWVMSSHWLHVKTRPFPSACSYGDVSFSFALAEPSPVVIVLSQITDRYFTEISGRYQWTFHFVLFRKGEKDYIAQSSHSRLYARSVNLEASLWSGEYVVHVRLDRTVYRTEGYYEATLPSWDKRTLARTLTERATSQSIVFNFDISSEKLNLPTSLDILAGQDIAELEAKAYVHIQAQKSARDAALKNAREHEEKAKVERRAKNWFIFSFFWRLISYLRSKNLEIALMLIGLDWLLHLLPNPPKVADVLTPAPPLVIPAPSKDVYPLSDEDSVFLGLKVYSQAQAPVVAISGQLRHQTDIDLSPALALPSSS